MKKIIQMLVVTLAITCGSHVQAGVVENKVVNLISQSMLNEKTESTDSFGFSMNVRSVTTETGQKTLTENANVLMNVKLTSNTALKLQKVEGSLRLTLPEMNQTLPLNIISQTDATGKTYTYIYMYPAYSQLLRQMNNSNALDQFDNSWIKFDSSEFTPATEKVDVTDLRSKLKTIWNNTTWFTAKSSKSGTATTYTIKIKPAIFLAKLEKSLILSDSQKNKSLAEINKDKAELIALLNKTTIQLVEKNGKLSGYKASFSGNDVITTSSVNGITNKKTIKKVTTTGVFSISGQVLPVETITLPARFIDFNMASMAQTFVPAVTTTTQKKVLDMVFPVPEGYLFEVVNGIYYIWKDEGDDYTPSISVNAKVDAWTITDLVKMNNDAKAKELFKEWSPNVTNGYIKTINGRTYLIKEEILPPKSAKKDTSASNDKSFQVNSLMAFTYRGDTVYLIEFTDDYASYDRNKSMLENFLATVKFQ